MKNKIKIAVTTASGNLGSAIIKSLANEIGKENVIGIARTPAKAEHLGVEIRKGDYTNRGELEIALRGVDAVLIVSGMDAPDNRIGQHRNVIEAAKNTGVKKIVYTSICGKPGETTFDSIISSNRQTEEDVKNSGLDWVIGRNGLYIEPDLEFVDVYKKAGKISNCAGDGKCGYTTRYELAFAYTKMLIEEKHNGNIYNLVGESITQQQLADYINRVYDLSLFYEAMSIEEYEKEKKAELGEFLGSVIAGIYSGIRNGAFEMQSDFEKAAGRKHKSALEMISGYRNN